jgi:ketopantoate reductase
MTMWLSGKKIKPGEFEISHIQRGYPIKEVFKKNKSIVNMLRLDLKKNTKSPLIKDIYFESFSKSINSLAFNLIALKYNQNNFELKKNKKAIQEITSILKEGDLFLKKFKIKILQTSKSRIIQTLKSSKHIMSMLNAKRQGKKNELSKLYRNFKLTEDLYNFKFKNLNKIYKEYNNN